MAIFVKGVIDWDPSPGTWAVSVDKRRKEGLQLNPGLSKYRVGLDDYERMEGLIVGRS